MADETQGRASFLYRWRWRIILLLLLVRVALPEVVRRVIVSQASARLQTRVEVGDVDLSFLRGGIALEDVAIHSPTPQAPNEPPPLAWKRFAISVRYLPLLWKTVQVRQIEIEGPHVALDRLADGELNLRQLVPPSEPAPPEGAEKGEAAAAGSGWKIGIDRFVLRTGGIRFRDLMVAEGEPLEIAIPDIAVDQVALQPGLYGEPGRARVVVHTEGGSVRVDSQLWVLDKGFAVGTRVKAYRLPLRRARLYVPGVGWSELQGEVDAAVDYGLAPGARNEVRGTVRLRDVSIRVPDLVDAAFSLKHFAVRVDPIDLAAHNARVADVNIAGLSVVVNLQGGDVLPLLAKRGKTPAPGAAGAPGEKARPPEEGPPGPDNPTAGESAPTKAEPTAEAPPTETPPAPAEPAPKAETPKAATPPNEEASPKQEATAAEAVPWHWRLETARLADSQVSLVQEGSPLDIGLAATLRRLADKGPPGRVTLDVTVAPGSVAIAGALRAVPPAFGGTVHVEQLPVHELIRAARAAAQLAPGLTKHALLDVDLAVEAGVTAKGEPGSPADTVRVSGTIGVDGLEVAGDDPNVFGVSMKRFALPIDKLELPGLVPGAPAGASKAPIHVALGAVRLEEPVVRVTRTAEGIVLPPQLGGGAGKPAESGAAPAAAPATEPAPPPSAAPAAGAAPPVDVTIASLVIEHGRVNFTDQSVKPFFTGQLQPIELDARGIKAAGPVIEKFTLALGTPGKGKIDASGSLRPGGGKIEVNGKEVALAPYNPYVTAFSPYSIGRNASLSVRTNVAIGKGTYDTKTALTLNKLTVKGAAGDTVFKQQFGISLSVALALLRDLQGNIKLDIPVGVDEKGMTIGIGTVVAGALRSALIGAVTSPLKMIGSVMGEGDAGISEPPPIAFHTGRTVLTDEGEKQVGQIAEFLSARPGVALELDGVVTAADARWLAEQDLRAEFEARTGVVNALRGLPERRTRNRVVAALAERAESKPGELDEDDRAKLDQWLAERPAVPADRLRDLARGRTEAVQAALRDKHGIPAERVTLDDPKGEPREGAPSVVIGFGSVGD